MKLVSRSKLKPSLYFLIAGLVTGGYFLFSVPEGIDKSRNTVHDEDPSMPRRIAAEAHRGFFVADLHADPLLWNRDFLKRHDWGHFDIPRMIEGGMALQVFGIVTKSPKGFNIHRTEDGPNLLTALSFLQGRRFWGGLAPRGLDQAGRLQKVAKRSEGRFRVIETREGLKRFIEDRKKDPSLTAGLLAIEGLHALDGDIANIELFFKAGVRMMAPTHFFDNRLGGSAHGVKKGGLTPFGEKAIDRIDELKIVIDVAHGSNRLIRDILKRTKRPIVVSHTGLKGTCDNPRNLSDEIVKEIAAKGGLIGVGFWQTAVCGRRPAAVAKALRHGAKLVGVEHMALGSDFDGLVKTVFDVAAMPKMTEALFEAGFSPEESGRIMGGNVRDFLLKNLPR